MSEIILYILVFISLFLNCVLIYAIRSNVKVIRLEIDNIIAIIENLHGIEITQGDGDE